MASKKSKARKESSALNKMYFGARRRLLASKIFFSKELEAKRIEAISQGATPWKILRYQRVVDPADIPFPISAHDYVTPELFEVQMKYLSRNCKVVPFSRLVQMIENYEEVPERTVALTFDGGFASSFLNATSILVKYGLPSTHFLPTGYIESGNFLLDDKLLMCIVVLIMNDQEIPRFDFIDESLLEALDASRNKKTLDRQALSDFVTVSRELEEPDRKQLSLTLLKEATRFSTLPDHEDFMRWEDIETLYNGANTEIGSLGHFLVSRPKANAEDALADIETSFDSLKERGIESLGIVATPSGMEVPYASALFSNTNLRYLLLNSSFAEPRFQIKTPMLLGRIPVSQLNAYCLEVFACRLFEISSAEIQF